jgi:CheY-like chemotaxis protein
MIVCAIDDLIFSVKVSTAAKALGVELYFERSAEQLLPTVRAKRPTLVIFDLNSRRLQPLAAIAAMKSDPDLAETKTLGFVAHVDAETIEAARQAGVDRVLARSAFAERLGELLTSA